MNHFHAHPQSLPERGGLRVLALAGSLRRHSWNQRLLEAAAASAPDGMAVEVYRDLASIPMFSEDLEHDTGGGPEPVRQLRNAVARADGLLISTPEYNQSFPGVLKNTIEWLSRAAPVDDVLATKPVAVIGATVGGGGTRSAQHALRQTLFATESRVMPAPALQLRNAPALFDDAGRLHDAETRESLQAVLDGFAVWIRATAYCPA